MEPKYRNIIDRVIKKNYYFDYPENVHVHDDSSTICQLGLGRIMKAISVFSEELRWFSLPFINLNAFQYCKMVDLQNTSVKEPARKRSALHHQKQQKLSFIPLPHTSSGEGDKTRE